MSLPFRTLLLLLAGASLASAQTPAPDRSVAPTPGAPPALVLPSIQKHALSNGLAVWLVEQHEVPVAHVSLVMRAGAASDPLPKAGVASLMAALMTEGAGTRDALTLADAVDVLGASLNAAAGWDATSVELHVPVARLKDALPLMADVALRPTFAEKDVERVRAELLTAFVSQRDSARALATRAFAQAVFGTTHRYGTAVQGTSATVTGITPRDLRDAHARILLPAHAVLIVVGDTNAAAALPMLEQAFGGWRPAAGAQTPPVALAVAKPPLAREIVLVDKPGSAQSQIRIGTVGIGRQTPDYAAVTVMNTILGGSFTSRLNTNLREVHGYSYGANSRFDMRRAQGAFTAGAGVQTDKTRESVQEFFNEFAAMLKPVPPADASKAKNYVALGYPSEFETTQDIAGKLEELFVYELADDDPSTFVPAVTALTDADITATARKHITPEKFVVVVVGDRAKVEAGLKALGLGRVRVVGIDTVMGAAMPSR